MKDNIKLYYAAGPGNIVETFRHWVNGEEDPSQFARTYSSQFFSLVQGRGARGVAVSTNEKSACLQSENLTVKNRPVIFGKPKNTLQYLIRQAAAAYGIWKDVAKFRPSVAVIAEGTTFWTLLLPLRFLGTQFVPSIHCVVRLPGKQSRLRRALEWIELRSLRLLSPHCLSASREISDQVQTSNKHLFLPTYLRERFEKIPHAKFSDTNFNLLFIGRIEEDKGIFELLEAFQKVSKKSEKKYALEFCGTGNDAPKLSDTIDEIRSDRVVSMNGHCSFGKLQRKISAAHVIVVPTTSRFVEGFNQVIVEGVLAGRPVIATDVCPSANLFSNGVTIIPADSVSALTHAISNLSESEAAYNSAVESTGFDRERFFQSADSWGTQLDQCIEDLLSARQNISIQNSTRTA